MPEFLKVSEVAQRLRISRMTLYRWINEGAVECVRMGIKGRTVRIRSEEVERIVGKVDPRKEEE